MEGGVLLRSRKSDIWRGTLSPGGASITRAGSLVPQGCPGNRGTPAMDGIDPEGLRGGWAVRWQPEVGAGILGDPEPPLD